MCFALHLSRPFSFLIGQFRNVLCLCFSQPKIPEMFCNLEIIPALLHGDLWAGNVAEDDAGPIVFDPACFYGHSEFELAIAMMFGGFSSSFFSAYHSKIPKAPGFEKRNKLYQLFNYINHWNHFGTGYRGSTLNVMRKLLKWSSDMFQVSSRVHAWCQRDKPDDEKLPRNKKKAKLRWHLYTFDFSQNAWSILVVSAFCNL